MSFCSGICFGFLLMKHLFFVQILVRGKHIISFVKLIFSFDVCAPWQKPETCKCAWTGQSCIVVTKALLKHACLESYRIYELFRSSNYHNFYDCQMWVINHQICWFLYCSSVFDPRGPLLQLFLQTHMIYDDGVHEKWLMLFTSDAEAWQQWQRKLATIHSLKQKAWYTEYNNYRSKKTFRDGRCTVLQPMNHFCFDTTGHFACPNWQFMTVGINKCL